MSLDILGEGFDLHCGGQDLRFPHHENERAQAVVLGKTFANHWMHHAFVIDAEGEKMSKSLGNVLNMLDLLDQYDERAYRMLLLQTHYRSPVRVSLDSLEASQRTLAGLDSFAARSVVIGDGDPDPDILDQFRASMDADLDTPGASALLFDTLHKANALIDAGDDASAAQAAATVREMCVALGLDLRATADVPDDIAAKATALDEARAAKDFATADALRAELQADGWTVETTKNGTTIRR
jgi:cysteinyl-tRNA synthetase